MVGKDTEQRELIYSRISKTGVRLNLHAVKGHRNYSYAKDKDGKPLITNDRLFLLEIVDNEGNASASYPYFTDDIKECAYAVVRNKIIPSARQREADKIINRINEALEGK